MRRYSPGKDIAFTLVEVLLAVGLMGLVASIAIGPLVALVGRLEAVQKDYAVETSLFATAGAIASDCRQLLPQGSGASLRTIRKDLVGDRRTDVLIVWTGAPLKRGLPAATEVFAILEPGPFREKIRPGLYRWTLPGVSPDEVFPDRLDPGLGVMVARDVDRFALRVFDGKGWVEDFSGPIPPGLSIEIGRKGVRVTHVDSAMVF